MATPWNVRSPTTCPTKWLTNEVKNISYHLDKSFKTYEAAEEKYRSHVWTSEYESAGPVSGNDS